MRHLSGRHAQRERLARAAVSERDVPRLRRRPPPDQVLTVLVRNGYHPAVVSAEAGVPVRLRFHREERDPCSETVLLPELGRFADLPEGETVAIDCGPLEPGEYDFSCPRGVLHGRLVIR